MEKNPMESPVPIISKCLDPECKKLYKCTLEDEHCETKVLGGDGKCTKYEDCAENESTKLSHGYCKKDCMKKALLDLTKDLKKE